jgi:hypothetical protein
MPKENDETKPEGTEAETEEEEDTEAERLLAAAVKNKGKGGKPSDDDDTEDEDEAEAEAGANDTVPRAELLKAIKSRQAAKKRIREMETAIAAEKAKNETESEKAVREAQEKTLKAATDKYKPALVKAGATAALLAAGPKKGKDGVPRLLKLMDLDAIDLTDDNDLEGVEEEVMRLQEEYPELFNDGSESVKGDDDEEDEEKPKPRRRTTSKSQDGAGKKPAPKKLSTSELILKKMRGEA